MIVPPTADSTCGKVHYTRPFEPDESPGESGMNPATDVDWPHVASQPALPNIPTAHRSKAKEQYGLTGRRQNFITLHQFKRNVFWAIAWPVIVLPFAYSTGLLPELAVFGYGLGALTTALCISVSSLVGLNGTK